MMQPSVDQKSWSGVTRPTRPVALGDNETEAAMDMMPISSERQAQLEDYAHRHGIDPVAALDEFLADALEWQRREHDETVTAVMEAYEDVKAGRTRPIEEALETLRVKHGLPR